MTTITIAHKRYTKQTGAGRDWIEVMNVSVDGPTLHESTTDQQNSEYYRNVAFHLARTATTRLPAV
ncbi:MAG: hypothetical protein M3443_15890 [Actinomycetota bacterium]|nr:hypothetical protein [Actinomycetota bacterium]